MVLYKTLDQYLSQYLSTVQVSKESMYGLRRYGALKNLAKTSNAD